MAEWSCPTTYRALWKGAIFGEGDGISEDDLFSTHLAALYAAEDGAETRFHFNRGGLYKLGRVNGRVTAQPFYVFVPTPILITQNGLSYTWEEDWYENGGYISTYWTTHVEGTGDGKDEETTYTIVSREVIY
jgi:hypothetical protein